MRHLPQLLSSSNVCGGTARTVFNGQVERFLLKGRAKGNDVHLSFSYEVVNDGDTPADEPQSAEGASAPDAEAGAPTAEEVCGEDGSHDESAELTASIGRVMSGYLGQLKQQLIAEYEQREEAIRARIRKLEK